MDFSVLMSLYYKEKPEWLKESIDSVINQTVVPSEIVIIKDGTLTKELEDVLEYYKGKYGDLIQIYGYEKNRGLGLALNYGVQKCKYDIIARMDTDDISAPYRFEKQLNEFEKNKDLALVGSNTIEFTDKIENEISRRIMPETNDKIHEYSKTRNPFVHPSVMVKKDCLIKVGNYQNVYLCEDYDMWVRVLKENYQSYNIQENLVYMRVGKDFYKRRGGWKYFKSITAFKKKLYKAGYMSRTQYLKTYLASSIVSLSPGFVRDFIYKKMLRKNVKK